LPKYTFQGIVYTILVARAALRDLDEIWTVDSVAADTILALLQEAKVNQAILDSFTTQDFGAYRSADYHVDRWVAQQQAGRNLWRLKIWELENHAIKYRIVYALDPRISRYFVLGIFDRDFNYDESDPRTQRVLASYDSLGIDAFG
jgi:hypothetical protein